MFNYYVDDIHKVVVVGIPGGTVFRESIFIEV